MLAAIVVSCTSRINVGVIAIPLAWAVGACAGRPVDAVLGGFPAALFVTLSGVTILFSLSESNGTVGLLSYRLLGLARGKHRLVPPLIFLIACAVATVGPGAIVAIALVAPVAMAIGRRAGIPPFLIALMVANGANAGNLSPLSAVGIIANTRMAAAGLGGHEWKVWAANFLAHCMVGVAAYVLLVGRAHGRPAGPPDEKTALTPAQWLTVAVVTLWIVGVAGFGLTIGLSAFAAAAAIIVFRAADEAGAIKRMPWSAIVMVCGMTMLVTLVEKTPIPTPHATCSASCSSGVCR
jgi:di/tricarboxylate transporter